MKLLVGHDCSARRQRKSRGRRAPDRECLAIDREQSTNLWPKRAHPIGSDGLAMCLRVNQTISPFELGGVRDAIDGLLNARQRSVVTRLDCAHERRYAQPQRLTFDDSRIGLSINRKSVD